MDNATRRQLLDKARTTGYTGGILDVFAAYDQGQDLIQQFVDQQQQASMQPPMQVAQSPEEQEQGLRPAHEAGQTDQSMAFPNVQPGQSFNTMGMKVPIDINKVDNQGNLVESYKAVPPGIQNLPTGPYEGMVIESPARMKTGGAKTDPPANLPWINQQGQFTQVPPVQPKSFEGEVDKMLGYPQKKAFEKAGLVDNERHGRASLYTQQELQKYLDPVSAAAAANILGAAHEVSHLPERIKKSKSASGVYHNIRETAEDMFNNAVGAGIGMIPFVPLESKESLLMYLSDNNMMPDGVSMSRGDMYWKKKTGGVKKYQTAGFETPVADATDVKVNPLVKQIDLTNYQEANPVEQQSNFDYQSYYDKANKYLSRPIFKGTTLTAKDIADAAKDFYGATNYEYPLDLLLTQGQMETKLGKTLKSQHNYFNVGNTDSGATKNFASPKDSVRNYMDLMYNDYLAKGQKSPENLLKANSFVNAAGNRYASNPNYESELSKQKQYIGNYISKKMGGSYQSNQETAMYEWRSGLPEDSRKRYFVGGLKNRVLYNKAKYKR